MSEKRPRELFLNKGTLYCYGQGVFACHVPNWRTGKEKLETQKNPLKEAITTGNTNAAKVLFNNDYSLVFDEKDGLNALHSCIRYRNPKLVTQILEKENGKGLNYNLEPVPSERNRLDLKKSSLLHYAADLNWPGTSYQESNQGPDSTLYHEDARIKILKILLDDRFLTTL